MTVYELIEELQQWSPNDEVVVKQGRDYMLSMSSFTVKDLKRYFPNFTTATINNAVYLAKSKGFITATARGEYVVNKN